MKSILVFGDSNSWGYDYRTYDTATGTVKRLSPEERWPGRVQRELGSEYHIIENCLNARTNLVDDPFFPLRVGKPSLQVALDVNAPLDLVIIKLGCNDLKHMFALSAGMIAGAMEQLVIEAKKSYYGYPTPKILIVSPHPTHPKIGEMAFGFNFGPEAYGKSMELSKLYGEVAARQGAAFLDSAALNLELNDWDGLHYSVKDHEKLADAMAKKIKDILG